MVTFEGDALPKVLELYLEISQYPILAPTIRERLRGELYSRGIISPSDLEREVKHKALLSQKHEGLTDLVTRFCSKVTVADLHFTKTDRFWSLLDERFPG